jgi:hypothetical protein
MARLIDNLELVARGDFARLKRMCDVDDEDFADMLTELRAYDPKPGLKFGQGDREPVVPDILIAPGGKDSWSIAINEATLPRLVVNRSYYLELKNGCTDREAKSWLSEKLADAKWLIKALDQRQKTILKVAAEIVKQQEGFFKRGVAHLKPLTLKMVAEAIAVLQRSGVEPADGLSPEGASALSVIYRSYAPMLLSVATSIVRNRADAEDVVQDVFARLPRTIAQYRGWRPGVAAEPASLVEKRASVRAAIDAGVELCVGSDVGVFPHGDQAREIELLVEYGYPLTRVLRAATSGNAAIVTRNTMVVLA